MDLRSFLKNNLVMMDGGLGTLLQASGRLSGEYPERLNLTEPQLLQEIHRAYFDAGSHIVNTNTFGANLLKFDKNELREIVRAAVENAKIARDSAKGDKEKFIALDIGPLGKLLQPFGDYPFEAAVSVFAETVKLGVAYGVDLIVIETMNDAYETKAAVLAAKENSVLPIFVTNAYGEDGKLMTGATPAAMAALLEGLSVDAIGANCSLGPKQLRAVTEELLRVSSLPVILKPNAGLPHVEDGKTVFDVSPEEFAKDMHDAVLAGVRIAGGCCGTTPAYIAALKKALSGVKPLPVCDKGLTVASSYTHAVCFGERPVLIGERINPTGKKRLKQALTEGDLDYILNEAIVEEEKGAHILDVNVGVPGLDEAALLEKVVFELQAVTGLPLQIDTASPAAMARAMRLYNGKPIVNSVNGKQESMEAVFPLVKKYGGLVVALTLDENGIPETAEGRVAIAEKIIATAASYGIPKKELIFDTLAMTVSADNRAAGVTLAALRTIKERLGCHTSLGVSNISFGLPARDAVNHTFFALALENGLSAAIMNPHALSMMQTYYAFLALSGLDESCAAYMRFSEEHAAVKEAAPAPLHQNDGVSLLTRAVIKGLKSEAGSYAAAALKEKEPLRVITEEIVPALDLVGQGFEKNEVYLPSLLMSAEAAKAAFEQVKLALPPDSSEKKVPVVLATVEGDIHDIGKNIVKLLLENYGFAVSDLGRDVPPEEILRAVKETGAPLVGLSALMTTTVPAMERTIALLRTAGVPAKIVVGGAVLTKEYAAAIGADRYAKDAMETVRYAESLVH